MKNKRGFLFGLIWAFVIVIILILGIWFGFKISDGLVAFFNFLTKWWWAIGLSLFSLSKPGQAIWKFLLSKIGIKL